MTFDSPEALVNSVGAEFGPTEWVTITQERIDAFADATGDAQWIHTEPQRAARSPLGSTIAHGFLTLALTAPFLFDLLRVEGVRQIINAGSDRCRFLAPVPVDSAVRGRARILAVTQTAHGVLVAVAVTVELRGAERPALVVELRFIYVPDEGRSRKDDR